MSAEADEHREAGRSDGVRNHVRSALIYFGLAEDASSPPRAPNPRREFFTVLAAALALGGSVAGHRGSAVGWLSGALFVPAMVVALVNWRRPPDRQREVSNDVALPPVTIAAALWIVPRHDALWWPLAIGTALSLALVGLGRRASVERTAPPPM